LTFRCEGCGTCCSGPEEGYVWISREEIEAAAAFLQMGVEDFKEAYVRRVGIRYSLIEKEHNKDCIFLEAQGKQKQCQIYPVRPLQCRTWPFWRENLRSRSRWERAGEQCPGINQGYWYEAGRIETIQSGDLSGSELIQEADETLSAWVEAALNNKEIGSEIETLYEDMATPIGGADPSCENCGSCCDFERYGHRLFVTTLEMLYFLQGLRQAAADHPKTWKQPPDSGGCPYQQGAGCEARAFRPVSCRIFYCRDLPEAFQQELTEQALERLRKLHEKFGAPYYYADLREWLGIIARKETKKRS
jgi:Fe-S-cluster containining protein